MINNNKYDINPSGNLKSVSLDGGSQINNISLSMNGKNLIAATTMGYRMFSFDPLNEVTRSEGHDLFQKGVRLISILDTPESILLVLEDDPLRLMIWYESIQKCMGSVSFKEPIVRITRSGAFASVSTISHVHILNIHSAQIISSFATPEGQSHLAHLVPHPPEGGDAWMLLYIPDGNPNMFKVVKAKINFANPSPHFNVTTAAVDSSLIEAEQSTSHTPPQSFNWKRQPSPFDNSVNHQNNEVFTAHSQKQLPEINIDSAESHPANWLTHNNTITTSDSISDALIICPSSSDGGAPDSTAETNINIEKKETNTNNTNVGQPLHNNNKYKNNTITTVHEDTTTTTPTSLSIPTPQQNQKLIEEKNPKRFDLKSTSPLSTFSSSPVLVTQSAVAHHSPVMALSCSPCGSLCASASVKGTIVRVFDTSQCLMVAEVRRKALFVGVPAALRVGSNSMMDIKNYNREGISLNLLPYSRNHDNIHSYNHQLTNPTLATCGGTENTPPLSKTKDAVSFSTATNSYEFLLVVSSWTNASLNPIQIFDVSKYVFTPPSLADDSYMYAGDATYGLPPPPSLPPRANVRNGSGGASSKSGLLSNALSVISSGVSTVLSHAKDSIGDAAQAAASVMHHVLVSSSLTNVSGVASISLPPIMLESASAAACGRKSIPRLDDHVGELATNNGDGLINEPRASLMQPGGPLVDSNGRTIRQKSTTASSSSSSPPLRNLNNNKKTVNISSLLKDDVLYNNNSNISDKNLNGGGLATIHDVHSDRVNNSSYDDLNKINHPSIKTSDLKTLQQNEYANSKTSKAVSKISKPNSTSLTCRTSASLRSIPLGMRSVLLVGIIDSDILVVSIFGEATRIQVPSHVLPPGARLISCSSSSGSVSSNTSGTQRQINDNDLTNYQSNYKNQTNKKNCNNTTVWGGSARSNTIVWFGVNETPSEKDLGNDDNTETWCSI